MASSNRVIFVDTTLRDGEQAPGCTMNHAEKLRIAHQLEILGVDVIEAGFPASSQGDFDSVQAIAKQAGDNIEICGLARCMEKDIRRCWEAISVAKNPRIHTFLATSDLHMKYKLRKTPEQVIEMIKSSVSLAASLTSNVEFSCEDASRSDKDFLCRACGTAISAGATTINLPDTVGYAEPDEFAQLVKYVIENTPGADKAIFAIHCHDDLGLGVANTLAALRVGARQAEVTLCGIGERAGNTALEEIAMILKCHRQMGIETNINTRRISATSRMVSSLMNMPVQANKAIVGSNAFAQESGIHQDGMLKNRETYEIMTPQSIGRKSTDLVIGKHSGRNAVRTRLEELGYRLDDEQVNVVFAAVKDLANRNPESFK